MSLLSRLRSLFTRGARDRDLEPSELSDIRWIVVGLGNPGAKYSHTRHNAGFMVIDLLAARHGCEKSTSEFGAVVAKTVLSDSVTLLVKSETFYNATGDAVAPMLERYRVPVERLIIVQDDLDLVSGRLRIKQGGGDAGNRGVRSIAESLQNSEFIRVRIGVGRPPGHEDAVAHVLRPMSVDDAKSLALEVAADAVHAIVKEGLEPAMRRFNRRVAE